MLQYLGNDLYNVYIGDEKRQLTKQYIDELLAVLKSHEDFGDAGYEEGFLEGYDEATEMYECDCGEDWGEGFEIGKQEGYDEAFLIIDKHRNLQDKEILKALNNLDSKVRGRGV